VPLRARPSNGAVWACFGDRACQGPVKGSPMAARAGRKLFYVAGVGAVWFGGVGARGLGAFGAEHGDELMARQSEVWACWRAREGGATWFLGARACYKLLAGCNGSLNAMFAGRWWCGVRLGCLCVPTHHHRKKSRYFLANPPRRARKGRDPARPPDCRAYTNAVPSPRKELAPNVSQPCPRGAQLTAPRPGSVRNGPPGPQARSAAAAPRSCRAVPGTLGVGARPRRPPQGPAAPFSIATYRPTEIWTLPDPLLKKRVRGQNPPNPPAQSLNMSTRGCRTTWFQPKRPQNDPSPSTRHPPQPPTGAKNQYGHLIISSLENRPHLLRCGVSLYRIALS